MSKKCISLLVVFLLSPVLSAGQDAVEECSTIVPKGWTPTLEQAQTFIEDESAAKNGFSLPLSALVIYDSFIHSGSILYFLRKRFHEMPTAKGGDEKTWIRQYVGVRQNCLRTTNSRSSTRPFTARDASRAGWQEATGIYPSSPSMRTAWMFLAIESPDWP